MDDRLRVRGEIAVSMSRSDTIVDYVNALRQRVKELEAEAESWGGIVTEIRNVLDLSGGDHVIEAVKDLKSGVERLRGGLKAVSDLIDNSEGVCGLHLNGDMAPWEELRSNGRFAAWLVKFDEALK